MSGEKEKSTDETMSDTQDTDRDSTNQTIDDECDNKWDPGDKSKDTKDSKEKDEKEKSSDICRDYLRNVCRRKKHCKFAHPPGLKGSEGKSAKMFFYEAVYFQKVRDHLFVHFQFQ